ncbi:MAG: hypothetical protein CK425_07495 [Parachlamydia sp.]|nr:MAG: hypothetical protein CK425_07495 [Parachlamydia sp.]
MSHAHVVYTSGSIREIWKISLPLMFSWLSVVLMAFVDRLYLAYYSQEALNSTVTSCTLVMAFTYGLQTLCEMGSVFVAQYNGAQRFDQIGRVVWQVVWIGLFSAIFFVPFSYFAGDLFFANSSLGILENEYFSTLVFFGPFYGVIGAISGFYIGRGHTFMITLITGAANVLNAVLDPLLIFGFKELVPSLGVKGAALSSGLSCVMQALILLICFMKSKNRLFGNLDWQINWPLLFKCFKIGFPTALFVLLEFASWSGFYSMMRDASPTHILVAGICQSILILFVFFGLGIQKGIAAIAGNLIGANKTEQLSKLLKSGGYLIVWYFLFTCIPMMLFPDFIMNWFLHDPATLEGASAFMEFESIKGLLRTALVFSCIYLFLDNLRMLISGVLSGAGDTFFLMVSGVASVWVFLLLPAYIGIVKYQAGVSASMGIWVLYSFFAFLIPAYRFYTGSWKERKMIDSTPLLSDGA